jgi:hypothetical protein
MEVIDMKKSLPIVIGAVVLVVGALAYTFLSKSDQKGIQNGTNEATTMENTTSSDTFTGTLKEAISRGVAMKCTYQVEGSEYEGYVKGNNYRGKVQTAEGETGEVIVKDNCMWSWSENQAQGVKTCIQETDAEDESEDIWDQPDSSVDTSVNYRCVPATVTDAMFTPPTNIEFMDVDAMMENFGVDDAMQQ